MARLKNVPIKQTAKPTQSTSTGGKVKSGDGDDQSNQMSKEAESGGKKGKAKSSTQKKKDDKVLPAAQEAKVKKPRGRPPKKAVSNSTGEASSSASTSKPQPKTSTSKAKAKKAVEPNDEDDEEEDFLANFDVDTWVMGGYSESKTRAINKAMMECEVDDYGMDE